MTYRNMTVAQGAAHVLAQCKDEWLDYAAQNARGEYRGFAALHDKCDANMLLPFCNDDSVWDYDNGGLLGDYTDFCNAVMAEVTERILNRFALKR